jgi:hypothetical protein
LPDNLWIIKREEGKMNNMLDLAKSGNRDSDFGAYVSREAITNKGSL